MRKIYCYCLVLSFSLINIVSCRYVADQHDVSNEDWGPRLEQDTSFVIVSASYNNSKYCEASLTSLLDQNYQNFRVVVIDDATPDNTEASTKYGRMFDKLTQVRDNHPKGDKVTLIRNDVNVGAMANYYNMINDYTADDDVVVMVDGDDFLAHGDVLNILDEYYKNGAWVTYGNLELYPRDKIGWQWANDWLHELPPSALERIRAQSWITTHLKTFYAGLGKRIKVEDVQQNGEFLDTTSDLAVMFPVIEMAYHRVKFVPEVLYKYNVEGDSHDHDKKLLKQREVEHYLRHKKSYPKCQSVPRGYVRGVKRSQRKFFE